MSHDGPFKNTIMFHNGLHLKFTQMQYKSGDEVK